MRRRHELTDEQWERIKDHLPGKATDPGRTAADNRRFVNAVLYVLKTGIPPGKTCPLASASPTVCGNGTTAGVRRACGSGWPRHWVTARWPRRSRNCNSTRTASRPTRPR